MIENPKQGEGVVGPSSRRQALKEKEGFVYEGGTTRPRRPKRKAGGSTVFAAVVAMQAGKNLAPPAAAVPLRFVPPRNTRASCSRWVLLQPAETVVPVR